MRWTSPRLQLAAAIAVGAVARVLSLLENLGFPHGDVLLDSATAKSLSLGRGFWTPWEEGTTLIRDPIGTSVDTFGHPADQHGPLWPLLCAPIAKITGDAVLALQIVSFILGMLTIPLAARLFGKFSEKAGLIAMWAVALSLPLCDYSGNGSLYAGQVFGVLLLPLVAKQLDRTRDAIGAGALLGLLFLLNYQCVVLLPAFAATVFITRGWKGGVRPLLIAAGACFAVTLPWFVRNAVEFGDPLFTTNLDYVKYFLNLHRVDFETPRPEIVDDSTPGELLAGFAAWAPKNTAWFLATIHLAVAAFPIFALGGIQRLAGHRVDGRRSVAGWLLVAALLALLLAAGVWPQPKSRYIVPLVALAIGAASVELAAGARALPALAMVAATALILFYLNAPTDIGFPWKEYRFVMPAALLAPLAFFAPARKHLGCICIFLATLHGGFRVFISRNKVFAARYVFDVEVTGESMFGPPIATFYDVIGGPLREGFDKRDLYELRLVARSLRDAGVHRVLAPVDLAYFWQGGLVTTPWYFGQFPIDLLRECQKAFQLDGAVFPRNLFDATPGLQAFIFETRAELCYPPPDRTDYTSLMAIRWKH